jgi:hypothetical protein
MNQEKHENEAILGSCNDRCLHVSFIILVEPCETEIRDFWVHIFIQQYVARFQIPMYNL